MPNCFQTNSLKAAWYEGHDITPTKPLAWLGTPNDGPRISKRWLGGTSALGAGGAGQERPAFRTCWPRAPRRALLGWQRPGGNQKPDHETNIQPPFPAAPRINQPNMRGLKGPCPPRGNQHCFYSLPFPVSRLWLRTAFVLFRGGIGSRSFQGWVPKLKLGNQRNCLFKRK